jgi:hypothetical protein
LPKKTEVTGNKKVNTIFIIGFLLLATEALYAFEVPQDTIRNRSDKTTLLNDSVSKSHARSDAKMSLPTHSPKKASLYSAILPGFGQAYNKKYWKIPIVYAGFAAFGYFIDWNNKNYNINNKAYKDLTDKDPATESYLKLKQISYYDLDNPNDIAALKKGLTSNQDYYRRNRDLLIILTFAFYGLNILDASVDAHFFNFDISDDLTMKVQPQIIQQKNQNIFSLNCTINF